MDISFLIKPVLAGGGQMAKTLAHQGMATLERIGQDAAWAELWNGKERRHGQRRQHDRRTDRQEALLDTRSGIDRRKQGRRRGDAEPKFAGGFSLKA